MKKYLQRFALIIMIIAVSVTVLGGCDLFGGSMDELNQNQTEMSDRIAQLEDQLALLLAESGGTQTGKIEELESLIGEYRQQLESLGYDTTADVIASVIDSVVAIQVELKSSRGASAGYALGTGFFIQQGGYIATNSHVITPESGYSIGSVKVYLSDQTTTSPATIVADFPDIDVAILKCGLSDVKAVTVDTGIPAVGSRVIAIGTPVELELMFTSTAGMVSAINRGVYTDTTVHEFCIQHDAAINPGNSGGPLFNMAGHLVGVNFAGYTEYESLGFALETSVIKSLQDSIKRSILSGASSYIAPTLKIEVTDSVLDAIYPLGVGTFTGNGVKIVKRKTGAATTLSVGKIITAIDGTTIATRKDFYEQLLSKDSGASVRLTFSDGSSANYTI